MCFELTWVLEKLTVVHQNKSIDLELLCFDVVVMPCFLSLFFHILMEACNEAFFLQLNQLRKSFFYSIGICHLC